VPTTLQPSASVPDQYWDQSQHQSWYFPLWHRGYLQRQKLFETLLPVAETPVLAAGGRGGQRRTVPVVLFTGCFHLRSPAHCVLDFRAVDSGGTTHMMDGIFDPSAAPKFQVKVTGTAPIDGGNQGCEIRLGSERLRIHYVDANPEKKESWYYVRVMQRDRNMAWSSPIWIRYR
jgi:hypothetical protein